MQTHSIQSQYQEAREICTYLENQGFPTRLAGGCVRDLLLRVSPKDLDLATTAQPDAAKRLLARCGYRIIPTGLKYGTQTVITPLQAIEITTLRRDVACHGRHAQVTFSEAFEEDARRRDFTINALYQDGKGRIFDYVGGQADLAQRVLRFVGDPDARIREDYLRILRYFRFLARLGWAPIASQLEAVRRLRSGIGQLSGERIKWELDLMLAAQHAPMALGLAHETGVLTSCLPWFAPRDIESMTKMLEFLVGGQSPSHALLRLFSLFFFGNNGAPPHAELVDQMAALPFQRREKRALEGLARLIRACKQPIVAVNEILLLWERAHVDAALLDAYLEQLADATQSRWHPIIPHLLRGIASATEAPPTIEALQRVACRDRGPLSRALKALYYLNVWNEPRHVMPLLLNPQDCVSALTKPSNSPDFRAAIEPLISVLNTLGVGHAEREEHP